MSFWPEKGPPRVSAQHPPTKGEILTAWQRIVQGKILYPGPETASRILLERAKNRFIHEVNRSRGHDFDIQDIGRYEVLNG